MEHVLRSWIADILMSRLPLLAIAVRQRAKFEQWLKFELALHCEQHGATEVEVEAPLGNGCRSDVAFRYQDARYYVELKTPNTNWRMSGVENKTRPITMNVAAISEDARKLANCNGQGIVAFVLFPVPQGDNQWKTYLERISNELGIALSEDANCSRVTVPVGNGHFCEMVVCCFAYPE